MTDNAEVSSMQVLPSVLRKTAKGRGMSVVLVFIVERKRNAF